MTRDLWTNSSLRTQACDGSQTREDSSNFDGDLGGRERVGEQASVVGFDDVDGQVGVGLSQLVEEFLVEGKIY